MTVIQRRVMERLCEVLGTALCELWQFDAPSKQLSLAASTVDAREHAVEADAGSLHGYALASEEVVVVEDGTIEAHFAHPGHLSEQGLTRGMSVAIRENGSLWGALSVCDHRRRQFLRYDTNFLQSVAHLLGGGRRAAAQAARDRSRPA